MDEKEIERLPEIDPVNRQHLERYIRHCKLRSVKPTTIGMKTWKLYAFLKYIEFRDLAEVTQDDIETYYLHRRETCSPHTVANDVIELRTFYKWLRPDEWKDLFANIKPKRPKHDIPTDQVIRAGDVAKLLAACTVQRDRAVIALLWDSGCRLSEITSLNIGNLEFDRYGGVVVVDGKTGRRRIRLIDSVPDLQQWINMHPAGSDPEAPLFCNLRKPGGRVRWNNHSIQNTLKGIAKRAGVEKRIHPHGFRHGRATDRAPHYSEPEMRLKFGWEPGSTMPSVYVHLSGADVEQKDLRLAGLLDEDNLPKNPLAPKTCPRCRERNTPDTKYCRTCSMVLDAKTALTLDQMQADVAANPEVLQALIDKRIKELKAGGEI